ncbi:MAG: TetR/AcrR family transcriptional regulator [bacterium]|nr:TetR/AcrR family transcriptional regulator [bacterium]
MNDRISVTVAKGPGDSAAETRERILIEASRLLAVHGYRGTTTREIATAVGISQPSLFFHFATKRAIVEELYRFDIVPAVRALEKLVAGDGTPAAKLYAMIKAEMTRVIDSPYDMRAQISFEALNEPDLAPFRDLLTRFDDLTRLLIRSGQESGVFLQGDPWLAQQMVSGFLARSNLFATSDQLERSHPDRAASLVLRGLLADSAALDDIRRQADQLLPRYQAETYSPPAN